MQGHSRTGTLSDYHQAVLQACPGTKKQNIAHIYQTFLHSFFSVFLQGIVFVYDITNLPSFQHIAKWASDVDEVSALT